MAARLRSLILWLASPQGKKAFRYSVTSAISLVVSQVSFVVLFGTQTMGAKYSSITATLVGTVPSYILNRYWAFQKRDSNRVFHEVLPYVGMALISLVFSTWTTDFADAHASIAGKSALARILWVDGAYLGSFALLWIAKFAFLNKILFAKRDHHTVVVLAEEDPVA